jgi:hypothetical protein
VLKRKVELNHSLKDVIAFKESGKSESELYNEEELIIGRFVNSSPWAGAFLGISFGIGMISLTVKTRRT